MEVYGKTVTGLGPLGLPLSVNSLVPLHTTIMLTVFFVMTIGIVVLLTTPSHKSLKLVSLYRLTVSLFQIKCLPHSRRMQ